MVISFLFAVSLFLSGCTTLQLSSALASEPGLPVLPGPPVYSAPATEGSVVDADTGQPLEGVIVVAYWELKGLHAYPVGLMMVQEGVTGAEGRYSLPAWGPKPRWPVTGELDSTEPELLFFKSGYMRRYDYRDFPDLKHTQILKLLKVDPSSKEYAAAVRFADGQLEFAFVHHDCSWKQIPRMLIAIDQEVKLLREKGLTNRLLYNFNSLEDREGHNKPSLAKCGSVQEFFRSYAP